MSIEKTDFQKITKEKIPYTILLNPVIQHIQNAEALAIYVYLYSLPPDWLINKEHLAKKFNMGNKKLRDIFTYFSRSNLAKYSKDKNEKTGKMSGTSIHLLNGEQFDPTVPFKLIKTEAAKNAGSVKTEAAISDRVVGRRVGLEGLQKKHKHKRKEKEQKRENSPSILDYTLSPNIISVCAERGLDAESMLGDFRKYHKSMGTLEKFKDIDAALERWILKENSNKKKPNQNDQIKSTVKFWTPTTKEIKRLSKKGMKAKEEAMKAAGVITKRAYELKNDNKSKGSL